MADEALVAGLEKVQVDRTQHTGNLKASEEEKGIVPEKLQRDRSEPVDAESEKVKDASVVEGVGHGEKKEKLPKKVKKKATKKNKGATSTTDKLQCDSSDSKSGSGDDSASSKSGSGDDSSASKSGSGGDSKSESVSTVRAKKEKNGEENQTATTELVAAPDTKVHDAIAMENSQAIQEIRGDQNAGNEVKKDEADIQGEKEKKN